MENNKHKKPQKTFKEAELKLKQATNLPEISNVLIQLCEQIGNKIELHVHFSINTIDNVTNSVVSFVHGNENTVTTGSGIVGNHVQGGGINDIQIGHRTNGNKSPIDGSIDVLGFREFQKLTKENSLLINKQIKENELKINQIERK